MKESIAFSFNPKYISAELAESLAQAIGQWIVQRQGEIGTAPEDAQTPDAPSQRQATER